MSMRFYRIRFKIQDEKNRRLRLDNCKFVVLISVRFIDT